MKTLPQLNSSAALLLSPPDFYYSKQWKHMRTKTNPQLKHKKNPLFILIHQVCVWLDHLLWRSEEKLALTWDGESEVDFILEAGILTGHMHSPSLLWNSANILKLVQSHLLIISSSLRSFHLINCITKRNSTSSFYFLIQMPHPVNFYVSSMLLTKRVI